MDLKVLFCASEATPFAKTGGLADVAGALPKALSALGCDVRLLLPLYPSAREAAAPLEPVREWIPIPVGVHTYHGHLWKAADTNGPAVYFLEKDEFFHRPHLYAHPLRGDYEDNAERFILLSRAVYPLCRHLGWTPHILHLNDWQTATAAAYLHFHWRHDPAFASTRSLLTIHNLGYQGLFPGSFFGLTGLPPDAFSVDGMEFWGQVNFLKAGLVYSHGLTTVSPRYSREIQEPENGFGLDGVLRNRSADLRGILNGIDTSVWDPRTDPHLPAHFDAEHLSGKTECKKQLLREMGFPGEALDRALCVVISRLAAQKGVDLILQALDAMMELPLSLAVLGTGDPELEKALGEAERAHPDRVRVRLTFDESLAHRLEAGGDLFLMPSRYEPCGLNQMYSLRYGTIPLVAAVGGLDDSVVDAVRNPHTGTGFKFYRHTPEDFLAALKAALHLYENREKWRELQRRAMAQDFSWARAARAYLDFYRELAAD
ncbi:glycogen synthase (ADP-glucose) [Desulfacinum infernum DSM 9756]|uniref:Glycogen synthase n=1 Tax=Desulfacinum infernum DSM 9756 TaxID=1121391 RepID=A0A1M5IKG5_9BACT|nr:glycogen synthase GlgA [Desulfacinum infernum]SHG28761.1 glycogen synthase (ADP-glucose) [Desulfacinum infernum DSM 9756]